MLPSPTVVRNLLRSLFLCGASLAALAPASAQDGVTLDTVVVVDGGGGLEAEGYVGTEARVGTKTDTDVRKVPQSVALVTCEELGDRYRLTGIRRAADTGFVATRDDRTMIAPALALRSDDRNTHLTLLGEYFDLKAGGARGVPTLTIIRQGDPAYRDLDQERGRIGYAFEHRFSEALAVRQNLRCQTISTDMTYVPVLGLDPDGLSAARGTGQILANADGIAVDNRIEGRFRTGEVAHTVLAGLDTTDFDGQYRYGGGSAPDLDLCTRNYGRQPITPVAANSAINSDTHQSQVGLDVQDRAEYRRFVLTGGLRHDWLDTDSLNDVTPSATQRLSDSDLSGRVGLSDLFEGGVTPYASYATSFDPTRGEQVELGVEYAPDGLGFTLDAALFRIRQDNIPSTFDAQGFQRQEGAVRPEGFEIQANARLTDGHGLGLGSRFIAKTCADNRSTHENDGRVLIDGALAYDFGAADARLGGTEAQVIAKNLFDDRRAPVQQRRLLPRGGPQPDRFASLPLPKDPT